AFPEYGACKAAPVRIARSGQMINSISRKLRCHRQMIRHPDNGISDIKRAGRIAPLVSNNRESVARLRELQHRLDEILAERTIDPRCPQNDVLRVGLRYETLAFKLGASVDTARARGVRFNIGFVSVARENIIRGQMNDRNAAVL